MIPVIVDKTLKKFLYRIPGQHTYVANIYILQRSAILSTAHSYSYVCGAVNCIRVEESSTAEHLITHVCPKCKVYLGHTAVTKEIRDITVII